MITKFKGVQNGVVCVTYTKQHNAIVVIDNSNNENKTFMGWDVLGELWLMFESSFSDNITYTDAIKFFTPQIGQTFINAG